MVCELAGVAPRWVWPAWHRDGFAKKRSKITGRDAEIDTA